MSIKRAELGKVLASEKGGEIKVNLRLSRLFQRGESTWIEEKVSTVQRRRRRSFASTFVERRFVGLPANRRSRLAEEAVLV